MSQKILNIVLLMLVIASVAFTWMLRRDYTMRNVDFIPGMVASVPYDAQEENPNFSDGKTLQLPVEGSIARGYPPLHFSSGAEEAKRAGVELFNPIADSSARDVTRGAVLFSTYCQPCHGPAALGDGLVTKRGFPPPPSLLAEKAKTLKDGQMFHILTFGQGNMPSQASQISRLDRWRVIKHIRKLQSAAPIPSPPTVATR